VSRIQGEIIKTAKSSRLHCSSGMKYATLFNVSAGDLGNKLVEVGSEKLLIDKSTT